MATQSSTSPRPRKAAQRNSEGQVTSSARRTADDYYRSATLWPAELTRLRSILLQSGLTETLKWGAPCYTRNSSNVVGIGAYKSYFGLWFYQGALLEDSAGVLINAQPGKTKAQRQWRMQSAADIKPTIVRRYLAEAIAIADSGKAIKTERNETLQMPEELAGALRRTKGASAAFRALAPGKQREYAAYINDAKRETTRRSRIEKVIPMILNGAGLNDRYR